MEKIFQTHPSRFSCPDQTTLGNLVRPRTHSRGYHAPDCIRYRYSCHDPALYRFVGNFFKGPETVMDVGTGSGILAIVAAKSAASEVLAMDIQWESIENAQENMKLNDVQEIVSLICGSIDAVRPRTFDLIVANINRNTLTLLLPEFKHYTHDNSHLILSGILVSEDSSMKTLLSSLGYGIVEKRTKGEWMGYGVERIPF